MIHTDQTPTMPRHQSKLCKYGELCTAKKCAFRHPERGFFTDIRGTASAPRTTISGQDEKDLEFAAFAAEFEHSRKLNELAADIEYINWSTEAPYAITSYPDLGFFATWDDAYDILLSATYIDVRC